MRRLVLGLMFCCTGALAFSAQTPVRHIAETGAVASLPFSAAVQAGDFIYVTGTVGTDANGQLAADIGAQTDRTLDNIAEILKKAGASLTDVVATQVYLLDPANAAGMNAAYGARFSKNPPARTLIVTSGLANGKALIEINAIAVRHGLAHRAVQPRGWQPPPEPFSYGQKVGNTLFISGLTGRNPVDNSAPPDNIGIQTKTIMDNFGAVLKAAGMDYGDMTGGRVWISDMKYFEGVNAVYRTYFTKDLPARATQRYGMINPADLVAISGVAVKGPRRIVATAINADGSPGRKSPNYSFAVTVGNRMWVTGQGGQTPGDVAAQTREALAGMLRVLKAGGYTPGQIIEVAICLHDMKQFQQMNAAYLAVFQENKVLAKNLPARTTVQADDAVASRGSLVEFMMTAAR